MDTLTHLRTYAADTHLSHAGFIAALALSFDGTIRRPNDLPRQEGAIRRAFVESQLGGNARQRKFRKLLALGRNEGIDALNVLAQSWLDWRAVVGD